MADLTTAVAPALVGAQAVVQAQRRIDRLLNAELIDLPLYGKHPRHPRDVLNDVKIIARWVISTLWLGQIAHHIPADIVECLALQGARPMSQNNRTNPTAAETAAGITVALEVVNAPDAKSSARLLQELMTDRGLRASRKERVAGRHALSPAVRFAIDQVPTTTNYVARDSDRQS